MTEKQPSERSGTGEQGNFERRDLLKGITLGAAGLAGAGSAVNGVMAQDAQETETQPCNGWSIEYVATVPEGAEVTETFDVFEDGPTAEMDVVLGVSFQPATDDATQGVVQDTIPLGYNLTIVTDAPPEEREIVTRAFEEYGAHAFAGRVNTDAGGDVQVRKSVSLNDLGGTPQTGYVAVVTAIDLRGCCSATVCKPFAVSETGIGDVGTSDAAAEDDIPDAAGNQTEVQVDGNETGTNTTTTPANQTGG